MTKLGIFLIAIICIIININQVFGDCERSRFTLGAEDVCWVRKVEAVEKIHQAQRKIVNFAKKTFGMDTDEKVQPQKCDYYYCIFNEMNLINPDYDVPCKDRLTNWVKKNTKYEQAVILLERIQACSGELGNSMGSNQNFLADNVGAKERTVNDANQSRCEIAAEYMKCLAQDSSDSECPVFQYP